MATPGLVSATPWNHANPSHSTSLSKQPLRALQFLGVTMLPGLIVVLALEEILEKSAIGVLVGGFMGYILSNITKSGPSTD
jgi:hypothetical protein